jgi:small-conductance mechanosensitive channel
MPAVELSATLANISAFQGAPSSSAGGWLAIDLERLSANLVVIGLELVVVAFVCGIFYAALKAILSRLGTGKGVQGWRSTARLKAHRFLLVGFLLIVTVLVAYNGWVMTRGVDLRTHTVSLLRALDAEWRVTIAMAVGRLLLTAIALVVATGLFHRLMRSTERAVFRSGLFGAENASVMALFASLDHVIVNTAWLLLALAACQWLGLPTAFSDGLFLVIRVYLIVAVGLMVIRCTTAVVDAVAQLSERLARDRGWAHYYDRARSLLPTLRTCLEYVLWIGMVSLLLLQIDALRQFAVWGPRLMWGIALFFAGRVVIEVGSLEIEHQMLPKEGLGETDRRRRETMMPLVRSTFSYVVYFSVAVLTLSMLGFNPIPFLAGAGIIGLVIGFGAQSLIGDVVSGLFVLLENTYLVGDTIEISGTSGVVEAIEFRTTRIRDRDGRVLSIRNGDVKTVINYSKGYTMAVVPVDVAYDADLRSVFDALRRAGARLRAENADVMGDTTIDGITAFGKDMMTVRTSTRVRPGRHETVAAAFRILLKDTFDRQAPDVPRKTLVPGSREIREPQPAAARHS